MLGLRTNASQREVESAFRRRALHCHPDRNPEDPTAKAKFERLARAKEILLNPVQRTQAQKAAESRNAGMPRGARSAADRIPFSEKVREAAKAREAAKVQRRREAAAKRQKECRDRLHRREEAAAAQRKREREQEEEAGRRTADAKRRCDQFFAEEDARESAAVHERHREALFGSWWKKHKAGLRNDRHDKPTSSAGSGTSLPSALRALIERFAAQPAASQKQTLKIPDGPLDALGSAALTELTALAALLGLRVNKEASYLVVSRPAAEKSDSDSPCEPPAGFPDADKKPQTPLGRKPRTRAVMAERHRQALERLEARRRAGEGLQHVPQVAGSWWVPDIEAERWDRCWY